MVNIKQNFLKIILSFFCLLYLSACNTIQQQEIIVKETIAKEEIEVAILMPMTGSDADLGKQYTNLIKMGLEDGIKTYVHVTSYDGSSEKNILAAMDKIITRNTKIILGPLYSNFTSLIAEKAKAHNIIIITLSNNSALADTRLFVFGHAPLKQLIKIISYFSQNDYKNFIALLPQGKYSQTANQVIQNLLIQKNALLARTEFYSNTPESIEKAVAKIEETVDSINEISDSLKPVIYLSDDSKILNLVYNSLHKHNLDKKAVVIGDNRADIDYPDINITFTGSLNILNTDVAERAKELDISHMSFMHLLSYDLGKMTGNYISNDFATENFLARINSRAPYIGISGNIHFVDSIAQRQYDIIGKEDGVYTTIAQGR